MEINLLPFDATESDVLEMGFHERLIGMTDVSQTVEILRVIGGWIYTTTDMEDRDNCLMTSVFVPEQYDE